MFLGHIAVGFASKRLAPRTSLGWLMTWLFVPWAFWVERTRALRAPAA